jgi:hypothetical protein
VTETPIPMIPEEDLSILEVLKLTDPALVKSLLLLKNSSKESQLNILSSRAKVMVTKYNQLVA